MTYFRDGSDLTPPEFRAAAPEVHDDPDARFRDGFTIGAAVASSIAIGCGLVALFAAIWLGDL